MITEPNQPINPTIFDERHNPAFVRDNDGLTKREYFSGIALQGLLANSNNEVCNQLTVNDGWHEPKQLALISVQIADALIAELNKPTK